MAQQLPSRCLNLSQHAVECVCKLSQVVIGGLGGADGKILINRHGFRGARQTGDRFRDRGLELGRK